MSAPSGMGLHRPRDGLTSLSAPALATAFLGPPQATPNRHDRAVSEPKEKKGIGGRNGLERELGAAFLFEVVVARREPVVAEWALSRSATRCALLRCLLTPSLIGWSNRENGHLVRESIHRRCELAPRC